MTAAPDLETWRTALTQAIAHNSEGRPAAAERAFTRLLTQATAGGDTAPEVLVVLARAHLGRAVSTFEQRGNATFALRDLDEATELARRAEAPEVLVAVLGQRALLELSRGATAEALRVFDAAAELLDAAEPFDQLCILLNRGALHLERGNVALARRDLLRCVALAIAADDRVLEFKARHNLGYVEFLAGNLPRALAEMALAGAIDAGGPWPTALLDQARVLREAGLATEAESRLRTAEQMYAAERLWQGVGETLLTRAECALSRDPVEAAHLAARARRIFRRRTNVLWQRKAEHVVLLAELTARRTNASVRALRSLAGRAEAFAGTCAAEGRRDLERSARLVAADALLLAGLVPDAATPVAINRQDSLAIRLLTREVRARLALATDDTPRACAETRRGLAEVRAYQARFGSLDMRTASAVHGVALAELDLDLALRRGRPAALLASIEQTRAASSRLPPVLPPHDDEEAGLLAELRVVEEEARALEGSAEPAEPARLRARAAELRGGVRARAWHREASTNGAAARAVVRASAVREALRDDETFVALAAHKGTWHAVVVGSGQTRHYVLADVDRTDELARRVRSDLDALALPLLPIGIRASVAASLAHGLAALDAALLAPLRLDGRRLTLSPSGMLAVLPWSLLPSRRGLPTVVAPSATAWWTATTAAGKSSADRSPSVSAFAGPGLNRAEEEADAVARAWGTATTAGVVATMRAAAGPPATGAGGLATTGTTATTAALVHALTSSDVVHIAAHGRHEPDNPLFSSLRMADGPLYAHELDGHGTAAACVVLSACEVGLWTVRPGDEALGLTSVLLRLGVRSVVGGVAKVSDAVAEDVMVRMHRLMATGVDSASALATAQAQLDDDAVAPFVCFGSGWAAGRLDGSPPADAKGERAGTVPFSASL